MALKLDLKGYDNLARALEKAEEKVVKGFDKELSASAMEINLRQKQATPVNTGTLRASNIVDTGKPLVKILTNNRHYAPYIEFGTGALVSVPPGLEEEAIVFKGAGIRKVNINAQPFFFRPAFEEFAKLPERLKKMLSE